MTTEMIDIATEESVHPLSPHWIRTVKEVRNAAASKDQFAVWIVMETKLADSLVRATSLSSKGRGYILIMDQVRPQQLTVLSRHFKSVAFSPKVRNALPKEELIEALRSNDRKDRFIAGFVDKKLELVFLWRGDFSTLVVQFAAFPATANGVKPNWDDFSITDYGKTLRFGDYESSADATLYELDREFRRKMNKRRQEVDQTLGASIRRLRRQRRLTRADFKETDAKTLGRIERGEVKVPQAKTLAQIASTLGVSVNELVDY